MPELSHRIEILHVSPIRRVAILLSEARTRGEIISFGGGSPSLPPPKEVVEEVRRILAENPQQACAYTGTRGFLELRRLIAEDWSAHGGSDHSAKDEVILTEGSTEGIFDLFLSLFNKNDEVILTDPTYLGYKEAAQLAGARAVYLPVSVKDGYQPNVEKLKSKISGKTKAFILLSPDNPTGRCIKAEFAKALVDFASDHDFWIIHDVAYKDIIYSGQNYALDSLPGGHERTVIIGTFSKEASVPGMRVGYALGPKEAIDSMEKMKQYSSLAPNSISQYAMLHFLSHGIKGRYLREVVLPTYRARMELMGQAIAKHLPEAKTIKPDGAFYYFVDMNEYLRKMNANDDEFSKRLLDAKKVVAIPGSFFGNNGANHLRLTFVSEPNDRIEAGIKAMGEYVFSYAFGTA